MTIEHRSPTRFINYFIRLLIIGIVSVGLVGILFYNQTVAARHRVSVLKKTVEELQAKNGEDKNILYGLTDSQNLSAAATRLGLVREMHPTYMNLSAAETVARN